MDKKTINLIRASLRNASLRWSTRNEALKRAKVYKPRYKKDGSLSKQSHVTYQCSRCKKDHFKAKDVDVDHIEGVGRFMGNWHDYIKRLFCPLDNLQILCKPCHKRKTLHAQIKI